MNRIRKYKVFQKIFTFVISFSLLTSSVLPAFSLPFSPQPAFAAGGGTCKASADPVRSKLTPKVGGVALDMAAKFLADMSEVTGAYYDASLDRIVFVGKKNTTAPQFDKDDMAVAIKAVIFNRSIPAVSMESDPADPTGPNLKMYYYGGIENTRFGDVLYRADRKLKIYTQGYDENKQKITSSVVGYKSFFDRYIELGPASDASGDSRFWISPQLITLRKDDPNSAFVFDTVKMQVKTEGLSPENDPAWNQAAQEFADFQTAHYDEFAAETPAYAQAKQLGKIVAVIKWISDSGIATDFDWARDYAPKKVTTPTYVPRLTTPYQDAGGFEISITGGVEYFLPNTYSADNGISAGLKSSSQLVPTTKQDIHWTFTKDNQSYEAVAVAADAFRSLGSYNTATTDFSTPIAGDLNLTFQRSYSSYSGGQYGVGRGWNIYPAQLYNNAPSKQFVTCNGVNVVPELGFVSPAGKESFTFNCVNGYSADDPAYHSKVVRNSDASYTVTLKNQVKYIFNWDFSLKQIIDKNGNVINYTYDGSSRLTSITDTKNHALTLAYSTEGLISSVTDWSGRKVEYGYDDQGNLLTVKDPNGNITTYTYDANFKLIAITDREGKNVVTNTYDADARLKTQKDASGLVLTYAKDDVNRSITTTDNLGRTLKTVYDTKARVLQQIDPYTKAVVYTYGREYAPLTITDKNNSKITNTYDAAGNLKTVTFPDTKVITYDYDAKNRLIKITDIRYGATAKVTIFTYDDSTGNLTQSSEVNLVTKYTYDLTGELLTLTDPLNHITTWTRDTLGNKITEKDATNNITTFEYDAIGRVKKVTDADTKTVSYIYDGNGNVLTRTDSVGTTTNVYDKENRLVKTTLPNNSITQYAYNTSGSLTSVTDALTNITSYGYDSYQNLTGQTDALNRTTANIYDNLNRQTQSTTPLGKVSKWEYDSNGNITKRIDANNASTSYTYDAFNRLTKITYPDLTSVTFTYDNRGNRLSMVDPSGTTTYTYDSFDRLTKVTNPYNLSVSYSYDNADNLTKITYPDFNSVSYSYDNANRLSKVTDWNLLQTTYTYNKNGLISSRSMPNGIVTNYTYDASNRLTSIAHVKGIGTLAKFTYTRDGVGNITKSVEEGSFIVAAPNTKTTTFGYDSLSRLSSAVYPDGKNYSYSYDKVDNRLTQILNGTTKNYAYDNDNKLTMGGGLSYTYDNNGNQIGKSSGSSLPNLQLFFDFENRLTKHIAANGNTTWMKYDGLGNRLEQKFQTSATTRYVNDVSGSMTRTLALTGTTNYPTTEYVYGVGLISGGGNFGTSDRTYYLEDGLGNTRFITSSAGGISSSTEYDAFGAVRASSGLPWNEFQFNTQQLDSNTGLYYLRARYYDSDTGRFISRDPVKGRIGIPQTENPYSYAQNNPINMNDPAGEEAGTYSVYLGVDAAGQVRYVGITCRDVATRAGEHKSLGDIIKSNLDYRTVHQGLDKLTARGSEQAYIDNYGLAKDGGQLVNKVNSISPNNPLLNQAKDQAQQAGAVPAAAAGGGILSTISEFFSSLVRAPVPVMVTPQNMPINYQNGQES